METKANIRKRLRSIRKKLTIEQVCDCSSKICEKLINDRSICQNDYLFVYSATQNEVDLTEFIHYALGNAMKVAFPRVDGADMDFYEVTSLKQLETGAFLIMEPKAECKIIIPSQNETIGMLVPGVGFSLEGYRIGYGKGFYDRYLAKYPWIHTIGVAYEKQLCEEFLSDEFDVPMDKVITEEREVVINDKFGNVM